MKSKDIFELIRSYVWERKKHLMFFALSSAVFAAVFYIYSIPAEAVLYAFWLCFFIGIAAASWDFYSYLKKIESLRIQRNKITLSIDSLPEPVNQTEEEYQNIIRIIHEDKINQINASNSLRSSLADYYTTWAHQIKTPIAAMRLLLQSDESELNKDISMELFKIEEYVEMVLQYVRLDSSSTDFLIREYNLGEIVKQAVRKYAKVFIRKKIVLDFPFFDCAVLTDEKWAVFVIEQILSNALKYTNKGKISIYLGDRKRKILVIEDTGIGIKEEDLPRVFENGFTGYNGRMFKKSTGIGLYLSKRILEKLSHAVIIESEAGKGTRVKIFFENIDLETE
ncbi:MAG: sensor histidine kinase [Sedimentibacter sp.]|uniref:sensor histidine kinase n=1 Tax=Sedimentibacter sp. TaxID=1960295 RepID=UPI0031592291